MAPKLIEIIHNRFESIEEDTEYIAKGFKNFKASGDTQTLEVAADAILENAKVVDKVTQLIQSGQRCVADMDTQKDNKLTERKHSRPDHFYTNKEGVLWKRNCLNNNRNYKTGLYIPTLHKMRGKL